MRHAVLSTFTYLLKIDRQYILEIILKSRSLVLLLYFILLCFWNTLTLLIRKEARFYPEAISVTKQAATFMYHVSGRDLSLLPL
jgi:hypothetical protein